ncbi:MAG: hypothetical protein ACRD9R_04945, partial [Pyrinomonadaceae bacterium]
MKLPEEAVRIASTGSCAELLRAAEYRPEEIQPAISFTANPDRINAGETVEICSQISGLGSVNVASMELLDDEG